jgi:hypothetical protein
MANEKSIRIVKRGEQQRQPVAAKVHSTHQTAREVVGTVTNWVTEFQLRRREETTNALSILSKRSVPVEIR